MRGVNDKIEIIKDKYNLLDFLFYDNHPWGGQSDDTMSTPKRGKKPASQDCELKTSERGMKKKTLSGIISWLYNIHNKCRAGWQLCGWAMKKPRQRDYFSIRKIMAGEKCTAWLSTFHLLTISSVVSVLRRAGCATKLLPSAFTRHVGNFRAKVCLGLRRWKKLIIVGVQGDDMRRS